jgi:uncharacterized protein (DUF1499 family)
MKYSTLKITAAILCVVLALALCLVPWSAEASTSSGDPELAPITSSYDFDTVFWTATRVARSMPLWTLTEVQKSDGVIQAEAKTPSGRYTDDVKIQIHRETPVRVEVHSASRVGLSDLGVNARRISMYLKALRIHLGS